MPQINMTCNEWVKKRLSDGCLHPVEDLWEDAMNLFYSNEDFRRAVNQPNMRSRRLAEGYNERVRSFLYLDN